MKLVPSVGENLAARDEGPQGALFATCPSITDGTQQHATGMYPHTWWRHHAPLPPSYLPQRIIS
jgi:hypothetical protein